MSFLAEIEENHPLIANYHRMFTRGGDVLIEQSPDELTISLSNYPQKFRFVKRGEHYELTVTSRQSFGDIVIPAESPTEE